MKKWSDQEVEDLNFGLSLGLSHEDIGECLGRSKSSVMHKVQKLGWATPNTQWLKELSKEEVLNFIQKYKTAEAMDYTENVPGHKSCQKILGVSSWKECLDLAGVPINTGGRLCLDSPTTFYIVRFKDTDSTTFFKYGITQRSPEQRYSLKSIDIVSQVIGSLTYCRDLEQRFSLAVSSRKYIPKDYKFHDSDKYGGYTECYI